MSAHESGVYSTTPLVDAGEAVVRVPSATPLTVVALRQKSALTFWVALTTPLAVADVWVMALGGITMGLAAVLLVRNDAVPDRTRLPSCDPCSW